LGSSGEEYRIGGHLVRAKEPAVAIGLIVGLVTVGEDLQAALWIRIRLISMTEVPETR
jgi:hypothetical protein